MKLKVAILAEKWCDLNINFGETSGSSNLLGSLQSSCLADITIFYYDEYLYNNGHPIDEFLLNHLDKPDFLVVSYFPVFNERRNVKIETFQTIRNMGIPIIFFWFDTIHPHIRDLALRMSDYSTLNIVIDGSPAFNEKFLSLWVPQNHRVFLNPQIERDIEVTFCGSTNQYEERRHYISYLLSQGIPLTVSGGQREHALSIKEYAKTLQRAKISINFSGKPDGTQQAKSRIYETMLCGAMLLEKNTEPIKKWFEPFIHYVPFDNEVDLVNKIRYYLADHQARNVIAQNGLEKMKSDYNSTIWWEQVFKAAKA